MKTKKNIVYQQSSKEMSHLENESVDLIVTSPPYFNIKDYSKDGNQVKQHSKKHENDIGSRSLFKDYIKDLLDVWMECERVLVPNGKLCINVPLMPMLKSELITHYNRHIYDLQSEIQQSILEHTGLFLLDLYIWNKTNPSKGLMFGSYPYPSNFYAQNTIEFITVFVKDGKSKDKRDKLIKERSILSQSQWIEFTKQIWNIPVANKGDMAYGKHSAIMPEEIAKRCIMLYSFVGDVVLDPFAGSGTTLKVARDLERNYVGYEIYAEYIKLIEEKLGNNK
jgi:site-specific DNA-methyltransferase (cytosine-N4-specific)